MACEERMRDIAEAMGIKTGHLSDLEAADEAVEAMAALCSAVEIPKGLSGLGVTEGVIPSMAVEAAGIERLMRNNPRKLSVADIEKIYRAAY
jgi:alcohol dehydrogenase class IV